MQKKISTKLKKSNTNSRRKAGSQNGTRSSAKQDLKDSIRATDERMLRLWEKIYEDHHPQQAKRG